MKKLFLIAAAFFLLATSAFSQSKARLDILEELYAEIWITTEVQAEYRLPLPPFISVQNPSFFGREPFSGTRLRNSKT